MAIKKVINGGVRDVADIKYVKEGNVRQVARVVYFVGGKLLTVWEWITGYIFSKDGYALMTKDEFVVKCKDQ